MPVVQVGGQRVAESGTVVIEGHGEAIIQVGGVSLRLIVDPDKEVGTYSNVGNPQGVEIRVGPHRSSTFSFSAITVELRDERYAIKLMGRAIDDGAVLAHAFDYTILVMPPF